MNLDEIDKKCFILALFIRDDGQRFLLGSGAYEFKDSQLHFSANTMSNDVVEVQGNDGYLLAGQVRRPTTQVFDGYIGDASINKPDIEGYRRDFFAFFQKNHFYTVVYIFPDGTSIQRRRGFIVDAGEVRELYQMFPEYHIGLNFEDVNYYKYSEDEDGNEQYAKSIDINISKAVSGGLIWDEVSQEQAYNHGTDFSISGTIASEPVDYIDLYGDTEQTTYSGKNLLKNLTNLQTDNGVTATLQSDGQLKATGTVGSEWNGSTISSYTNNSLTAGTYTFSIDHTISVPITVSCRNSSNQTVAHFAISAGSTSATVALDQDIARTSLWLNVSTGTSVNFTVKAQLEKNSSATSFEPYVGGMASPNPDYPQEVQTVTGRQVVTISDGDSQSQEYEINLGKNLVNPATLTADSRLNGDGTLLSGATGFSTSDYIPVEPNTTYTITRDAASSGFFGNLCQYNSSKTLVGTREYWDNAASYWPYHITTSSTTRYIRVSDQTTLFSTSFQIEKGSTATTYAPYFTPIELCKIGTYQDYIYKSGEDWYVKKNINKLVLNGSENWETTGTNVYALYVSGGIKSVAQGLLGVCNYYTFNPVQTSVTATLTAGQFAIQFINPNTQHRLFMKNTDISTTSDFQTWLGSHNTTVYYPLATPTDIQITNATLIAQLEALNSATTYAGVTWFKTESEYLPADTWAYVQIQAGGGVVWDNYGATWEEGGGGMIVNVNVDSIENVYPVWTVNGPTDTPILTNLTTGTSITYNGNITASQTLVVDMLNQTALLNGTSVIGKLSGDWIELAPGMNRMSYTATNEQTAPKSTLEWQEIVG